MSVKKIQILDLGLSNLLSIQNGIKKACDLEVSTIQAPEQIESAALLVLPGTGNFGKAIELMSNVGMSEGISSHVSAGGALFGICLGMQLMFDGSDESPEATGLGLFRGQVLQLAGRIEPVPHVGWKELRRSNSHTPGVFEKSLGHAMYFVHSFAVQSDDAGYGLVRADHGGEEFIAAVFDKDRRLAGCQFHPEKSSSKGIELISRIVQEI